MRQETSIGFIGLGQMGAPMARNLAKAGYSLVLYDIRQEIALEMAVSTGGSAVCEPAEAGVGVSVLITMLPNSTIVRDVILGTDSSAGAIANLEPGAVIIDMSSSSPRETVALAEIVAERDLIFVDAPVSGGVKKAKSGTLTIMMGGSRQQLESITPILEVMGSTLLHAGSTGAGHAAKALNNYVSAAGLLAAAEAVRVGEAFGIESTTLVDIFNASTGCNNSTLNKFHQFILSGTFASGFLLSLMAKDIDLAADLADATKETAPLLQCCASLWQSAAQELGPEADHTEISRYRKPSDA